MAKKYAVLGSPIAHSLSPKIHSYVFEKLNLAHHYESFDLAAGLEEFLAQHADFSGFSVTMPLKDEAYSLATTHSLLALQTQSVNTLLKVEVGYQGFNTDVYGIQAAVGFRPDTVAVLGSGATARSALAAFPMAKKLIFARNSNASKQLALQFKAEVVDLATALNSELVVSTLPAGALLELIPVGSKLRTLLDVTYTNPRVECERYISGLEMLIHQAISQQRIFQHGSESDRLDNEAELLEGLMTLLIVAK